MVGPEELERRTRQLDAELAALAMGLAEEWGCSPAEAMTTILMRSIDGAFQGAPMNARRMIDAKCAAVEVMMQPKELQDRKAVMQSGGKLGEAIQNYFEEAMSPARRPRGH